MVGNQIKQKLSKKYICEICNYITDRKSNLDNHKRSSKHIMAMDGNEIKQKLSNIYSCEYCNKTYKDNSGLWKHNKKCNYIHNIHDISCNNDSDNSDTNTKNNIDSNENLINYLVKENQEFKNLILEIIKKDTYNNSHNTNTNSHNKTFNLQFFLNETCKDAMNIMDFVDSIKFQLSDLEKMEQIGFVNGISNIIIKNLKDLDITQRPVHCTDKKREVIYVKDENKWEKEEQHKNTKVRKAIKRVANKNMRLLTEFREKHPDCNKSDSKYSDQYNKLVIEAMGGLNNIDYDNETKIITKVSKEIIIDKSES